MKISGQLHAPAAVTADKTPMLVKQEVCGGATTGVDILWTEKVLPLRRLKPRIVHPVT